MICKNCQTKNEDYACYCETCGADLSKARRKSPKEMTKAEMRLTCPNCQTKNSEGAVRCVECGADFSMRKEVPQRKKRPKTDKTKCPNCGEPKETYYCRKCYAEFDKTVNFTVLPKNHSCEKKMVCPNCKTVVDPDEKECPNCHADFSLTKRKIMLPPEKKATSNEKKVSSAAGTRLLCFNCGNVNPKTVTKCQACGKKLTGENEVRICKNCLTANALDSRYCENCGNDLTPRKAPQNSGGGCSVVILVVSISISLLLAIL